MHISNSHQYLGQRMAHRFPVWHNPPSDLPVQKRNPKLQQQSTKQPQGPVAVFDELAFFQGSTTDPIAQNQWLLRLNKPSQCKTYLKLVHAYFTAHKITECSNLLDSLQEDISTSIISSLYDSIDRDITKGLLRAEQKSAQAPY